MKKRFVLYVLCAITFSLCLLDRCKNVPEPKDVSHYIDTVESRIKQIEKCQSCHQEEYKNWKMGPHAYAYKGLENHQRHVDSSDNFPEGYNTFVKERMESVCMTCHTGKNLYEVNFAGVNHKGDPHLILKDSLPDVYKQAFSRSSKTKDYLFSGVDCITCHVQNDQVVTNAKSKSGDTLGLIKSKFFSDNMNCFSCHHHQVSTMKELVEKKKIPSEISCVNCHQEYTDQGIGTHYFYWRNGVVEKKRPKHLNIFECVKIALENENILKFEWTNTIMPHGYSECGDAMCKIIAVFKNKKEKVIIDQIINRKDFFDARPEMPKHFHIGKSGSNFEFNVPIIKTIDLNAYSTIDYIIIEGFVKPQYWSSEKEFVRIYKSEISLVDLQHNKS